MKENGKMVEWKGTECLNGKMEVFIKEIIKTI